MMQRDPKLSTYSYKSSKNLQSFGASFGLMAFGATSLQSEEGMKKSGNMIKENQGKEDR
jgi:hypothetical protein